MPEARDQWCAALRGSANFENVPHVVGAATRQLPVGLTKVL